jgi:bifunctional non-homologous end joining protein LigD
MHPAAGVRRDGLDKSPARARAFGALLLGQMENGKLVYKGKVGTGFDTQMLRIWPKPWLRWLRTNQPLVPGRRRAVPWIKPKLVAEIAFAQFTGDGRVRHASFLGCVRTRRRRM